MFQNLKTKNPNESVFQNMRQPRTMSRSPGTSSSVVKGDEANRLVRCRHCGWICDKDRDANLKDNSFAGHGISYSTTLTASTTLSFASAPETYVTREVVAGCPACGSYVYDPKQQLTSMPADTYSRAWGRKD